MGPGFMHTALDVSLERFHDHFDLSRRIAARAPAWTPVRRPALHPVHPPGSSGRYRTSAAGDSEPSRCSRDRCGTRDREQVHRCEFTAATGAAKIIPLDSGVNVAYEPPLLPSARPPSGTSISWSSAPARNARRSAWERVGEVRYRVYSGPRHAIGGQPPSRFPTSLERNIAHLIVVLERNSHKANEVFEDSGIFTRYR